MQSMTKQSSVAEISDKPSTERCDRCTVLRSTGVEGAVVTGVIRRSRARGAFAAVCGAAVMLAALLPAVASAADDPEDRKREVERRLEDVRADLNQSTRELDEATRAYREAESQLPGAEQTLAAAEDALAAAQSELARAQGRLAAARAEDARAAERLAAAEERVAEQEIKIGEVNEAIDEQRATLSNIAARAYRQGPLGRLADVAMVLEAESIEDFAARAMYAQSVLQAEDSVLTDYKDDRAKLANERVTLEELRAEADRLRQEAAAALERSQQLEAAARNAEQQAADRAAEAHAAKQAVDDLVEQRSTAVAAAEAAKENDAAAYAELEAERKKIDAEIAEIARKEREAAERRAREEAERREREEAERRERERKASSSSSSGGGSSSSSSSGSGSSSSSEKSSGGSSSAGSSGGGSGSTSGSGSSGGSGSSSGGSSSSLGYPVANPYVTSPYGMRTHPITKVYKLHDGTDFRAYCGTPIRASAAGRVRWAHYRGGYGNQVMVDHGTIGGTHLMTSYSHLSRFAVSAGTSVSKGQIIGYSGTTGYSTACHLHFMVYANGSRTNPMNHL